MEVINYISIIKIKKEYNIFSVVALDLSFNGTTETNLLKSKNMIILRHNIEEKIFTSQNRLPVSEEDLEKAKIDGVVQKRPDGKWGIIAIKKGLWWSQTYNSRENAEKALRAYHANNR